MIVCCGPTELKSGGTIRLASECGTLIREQFKNCFYILRGESSVIAATAISIDTQQKNSACLDGVILSIPLHRIITQITVSIKIRFEEHFIQGSCDSIIPAPFKEQANKFS